jgi:hypothetical protein
VKLAGGADVEHIGGEVVDVVIHGAVRRCKVIGCISTDWWVENTDDAFGEARSRGHLFVLY